MAKGVEDSGRKFRREKKTVDMSRRMKKPYWASDVLRRESTRCIYRACGREVRE